MGKPRNSLAFSFWATFYDQFTSFIGFGDKFRCETVKIAGMHHLNGQAKILDVGCGTGKLTIAVAASLKPGSIIYGIDPVPEMLEIARINRHKAEFQRSARIQVIFKQGRIEALPFKLNSFDLVLASMMTHHLDRGLKFCGLREIFRVLKPGGTFINVDFGAAALPGKGLQFKSLLQLGAFLYFNVLETLQSNFILLVKDHFTGLLPVLVSRVGFQNVEYLPSRHRWVVFLRARKPTLEGKSSN